MRSIARTLEVSVATYSPSVGTAKRAERLQALAAMHNPLQRYVALGIDRFAARRPEAAARVLNGIALALGRLHYLGNGAQASVYRQGDQVLKVFRHTAHLDAAALDEFVAIRNDRGNVVQEELGAAVVPQTLRAEIHPFGRYEVAVGRQEYTDGTSLTLFRPNTLDLRRTAIDSYREKPGGQQQLESLVAKTFALHDNAGLVPDLNGADNFRINEGDLLLIDPDPISESERPDVHGLILQQAERLGDYIQVS